MGNPKGFMTIQRVEAGNRPISERIEDFSEVEQTLNDADRQLQASRCMDCGIPFCQWSCPVGNTMPEFQDAVYKGNWEEAIKILHYTNNFPEFTGRICPAPCEKGCVLNIHKEPVTIRENECATVEKGFALGYIKPNPAKKKTGKKVAVIGSGPAGMAAADLLNKWGHTVTLFEKDEAVGGLLRFGIPDFKLNKVVIDRRVELMIAEGLIVKTNTHVGVDVKGQDIMKEYDAVCIAIGAMVPRDLPVPGRELKGIHFAMDFLTQQNRVVRGTEFSAEQRINAKGKHVLVIGGGDTGSDCVGTSNRHKAKSVTQIEIMPQPPVNRTADNPWPYWPLVLKTSSSHEEGCNRMWSLATKRFIGENGQVKQVEVIEVKWEKDASGRMNMVEVPGTEKIIEADLVFLAMGFVSPVHEGLLNELGVEYDARGNVKASADKKTSVDKVFVAGDATRGPSLVVHAIAEGRKMAESVHAFLMNK
ncbi:MAG TPA: glutamate synthase subunit beta [Bacteroidales bacterium]|nr:glutamate synthase subunit beta [Bacteroidales bacterium]